MRQRIIVGFQGDFGETQIKAVELKVTEHLRSRYKDAVLLATGEKNNNPLKIKVYTEGFDNNTQTEIQVKELLNVLLNK